MKSNLLVLLSEYPINHVVYKDFDILNIDKQTFRNDISDDNLWFIEALNYSNFLKNELEFERPIGYIKVLFQKIDTIEDINESLLKFSGDLNNHIIYVDSTNYFSKGASGNNELNLINPESWMANSLTYNIISSINSGLLLNRYWEKYFNLNDMIKFRLLFYSHCLIHNIFSQCIK